MAVSDQQPAGPQQQGGDEDGNTAARSADANDFGEGKPAQETPPPAASSGAHGSANAGDQQDRTDDKEDRTDDKASDSHGHGKQADNGHTSADSHGYGKQADNGHTSAKSGHKEEDSPTPVASSTPGSDHATKKEDQEGDQQTSSGLKENHGAEKKEGDLNSDVKVSPANSQSQNDQVKDQSANEEQTDDASAAALATGLKPDAETGGLPRGPRSQHPLAVLADSELGTDGEPAETASALLSGLARKGPGAAAFPDVGPAASGKGNLGLWGRGDQVPRQLAAAGWSESEELPGEGTLVVRESAEQADSDLADLDLSLAGQLASFTPQRAGSLDTALRQFLDQIEDLGRELGQALASAGAARWLMALAAVGAAFEMARQQWRRSHPRLVLSADAATTLSWSAGLPGPFSVEEP